MCYFFARYLSFSSLNFNFSIWISLLNFLSYIVLLVLWSAYNLLIGTHLSLPETWSEKCWIFLFTVFSHFSPEIFELYFPEFWNFYKFRVIHSYLISCTMVLAFFPKFSVFPVICNWGWVSSSSELFFLGMCVLPFITSNCIVYLSILSLLFHISA